MGWVINTTLRPLYPQERPRTPSIGFWVGPWAGLDGYRKTRPLPGFDPRIAHHVASRYNDWAIPAHPVSDIYLYKGSSIVREILFLWHCMIVTPAQNPLPRRHDSSTNRCKGFKLYIITTQSFALAPFTLDFRCKGQNRPMYNEAGSCNHCCSGRVISITYSECSFVALGIQHTMGIGHIVNCDLSRSNIFFHIIS